MLECSSCATYVVPLVIEQGFELLQSGAGSTWLYLFELPTHLLLAVVQRKEF